MLGVQTIKRLSKKRKLKLQRKLENDSLNMRSRKVKRIILLATLTMAVGCVCYTYLPSRRFILAIGSKVFKSKSIDSTTLVETPVSNPYSGINDDQPFALLSGMVIFTAILKTYIELLNVIFD